MRFNTKQVSLYELLEMIDVGRFDYKSYFRLPARWNIRFKSQLIESIILGVPNEEVWAEEDKYGQINILSGIDIISTLIEFKEGRFKLKGLRYLYEFEGAYFNDLQYSFKDDLFESILNLNILHYDLNPLIKCLFLKKVNKVKLGRVSNQVARNFCFRKAGERLREFSIYVFETFVDKDFGKRTNKAIDSFILSFQEDLLLFVLLNFMKERKRFDEWSHLKENTLNYTHNHEFVRLQDHDQVDIALDKVMFEIDMSSEVGIRELEQVFHEVNDILKADSSPIEKVGLINRNSFRDKYDSTLLEVIYGQHKLPPIRNEVPLWQLGRRLDL